MLLQQQPNNAVCAVCRYVVQVLLIGAWLWLPVSLFVALGLPVFAAITMKSAAVMSLQCTVTCYVLQVTAVQHQVNCIYSHSGQCAL
jgi:hypothetical protein